MRSERKKIPAYLVKENYQGRKIRVKGEIVSLNESEQTANMVMMGKLYKDIPASNIVINEAFMDDLKAMGRKARDFGKRAVDKVVDTAKNAWSNVFTTIKKVKGKLVALFGNQVRSNSPLLIAQQFKSRPGFGIWLPQSELQLAEDYGIHVENSDPDEVIQESAESIKEINDFLRLFVRNYRGSEMSLEESWGSEKARLKRIDEAWGKTVRMVEFNKRLNTGEWPACPPTKWSRREALNEAEAESQDDSNWAEDVARGGAASSSKVMNVSLDEAVDMIYSNLTNLIASGDPTSDDNKPMCVWGPPGIGKTVGIKSLVKSMQRFAGKAISTLSDLDNNSSNNSSEEIQKLQQEIKDILKSKGGYRSKATEDKIAKIEAKIRSLQTVSNPSMLYSLDDDIYDEAVEKLGDKLDDYTTYDAEWDTDIIVNPAEIYITCTGMTKDSFSLPSFTNEDVNTLTQEQKIDNLRKKFGKFNIDIDSKLKGENGDKFLQQIDKSFSSKTVLEIPKAWLPMYMPTGDEEIDKVLDEETYTMRGMAGSETCNCGVLFIDELSRVAGDVMNILMQLIQQRTYEGGWKLGRKWYIVFASNRLGDMDAKLAREFSWENAFGRRLMHCNILPKRSEWLKWAKSINPNTGKPNIEIEWIIQLLGGDTDEVNDADDAKNKLWLDLNDINPISGENLQKNTKGQRFTGGANPASWTAVSQKLAYINMFKEMYNDPENFRYPNGEPLSDREKKKIERYKQKNEIPPQIRGWITKDSLRNGKFDVNNFNDIMKVVQGIIGTDKGIKDAIEELMDYKKFWTPKRCKEVCTKGKTSDPADNRSDILPTWKQNLEYIDEIFQMILKEAKTLMDTSKGMEEVRDLAISYIKELEAAQKKQKEIGGDFDCPTYNAYLADNSIDYAGLGFKKNSGKAGRNRNPLSASMAYYLLSTKMLGPKNKSAVKDINNIFQNIIDYSILVAEQKQKNAGATELNTQTLGLLIGDKSSKYTDGVIYQAFNEWFLVPAQQYMQEISFEDAELDGHDEDEWLDAIRGFAATLLSVYMNYFVYKKPNELYKDVKSANEI